MVWGKEALQYAPALFKAVAKLSPEMKKALYVAIIKNKEIRQGTWNGCAFSRASEEITGKFINSADEAAELFYMSDADVRSFITAWDKYKVKGENPAEALKKMLLSVGIFSPPQRKIKMRHIFLEKTYTSKLTKNFEALVETIDFTNPDDFSWDQQKIAAAAPVAAKILA